MRLVRDALVRPLCVRFFEASCCCNVCLAPGIIGVSGGIAATMATLGVPAPVFTQAFGLMASGGVIGAAIAKKMEARCWHWARVALVLPSTHPFVRRR